jgi:hypothetical protein
MARTTTNSRTPVKPRSSRAIKPKELVVLAVLEQDHIVALQRAHNLVADAKFKVDVATHFLNKVNEELQEQYDLPTAFTINFQTGEITEGA